MQRVTTQSRPAVEPRSDPFRMDWLRDSVLSGFVATFAMTVAIAVAYGIANSIGDANAGTLRQWFAALSANEMTERVGDSFMVLMFLNLLVGLAWAIAYGRFFEPRMSGPGWRKGALFSLIPWFLSVVVFFPIAGIGFLGMGIDAGPMPVIGNLILHLVYGVVLGTMFNIEEADWLTDGKGEREAAASAERGASIGLVIGAVLGFIGGWFVGPTMEELATQPVIAIAGALSGAAVGILIGSLVGMRVDD